MNKILVLFILFSVTVNLYAETKQIKELTVNSGNYYFKDDIYYFNGDVEIKARFRFSGGTFMIKLDDRSKKYTQEFVSKERTLLKTISEPGTYFAKIYKYEIIGGYDEKKSKSIILEEDVIGPSLNISSSNNNWTASNVTLSANCSDSLSGLKEVSYSIGGNYISESSEWIEGSNVTVSSNTTVHFQASDNLGNSTTLSYNVKNIDKTKPIPKITLVNKNWTNDSVKIVSSSLDSESGIRRTEFKIDEGQWIEDNDGIIFIDTNCKVYCRVQNNAGLWSGENECILEIDNIDKIPPVCEVASSPSTITNSNVIVTAAGHDNQSGIKDYQYSYNNLNWFNGKSVEVENNKILYFRIIDISGNISKVIKYNVDFIDKTNPVPISFKEITSITNKPYNLIFDGSDENGIKKIEYFNEGNWITGNRITVSNNGRYRYRVTDNAGNSSESISIIDNFDNEPPSIVIITEPLDSTWINENRIINISITDKISGVKQFRYKVDNGEWSEFIDSNTYKVELVKNSTLSVEASDKVENISKLTFEEKKIDRIDPEIVISLSDKSITNNNIEIVFTSKDGESGIDKTQYSFDKTNWYYGNSLSISENRTLFCRTFDKAENSSGIYEITIDNIDKTQPIITDESETKGIFNKFDYKFKVVDYSSCNVKLYLNGIETKLEYNETTDIYSIDITKDLNGVISNGLNKIHLRITDVAGNITEHNNKIILDNTPPKVTSLTPFMDDNIYVKNFLNLKEVSDIFSQEIVKCFYSFDKETWIPYGEIINIIDLLSDGLHTLYVKGIDEALNYTIFQSDFIIDTQKPYLENFKITFNQNSEDIQANNHISISDLSIDEENPDYAKAQILDNKLNILKEQLFGDYSKSSDFNLLDLNEGDYILRVALVDLSGNNCLTDTPFTIDRTPPDVDKLIVELYTDNNDHIKVYEDFNVTSNNGALKLKFKNENREIVKPRYKYIVTPKTLDNIKINDSKNYDKEISTLTFEEGYGLYYIYSFIVDDAGNISYEPKVNNIYYDNREIPAPELYSLSNNNHATFPYNNPEFTIKNKFISNEVKVVEYIYELYKGSKIYKSDSLYANSNVSNINLSGLEDNNENEIYKLYVKAKSNSDKFSEFSEPYCFAIDTKAPEFLQIYSPSHSNENLNYSYDHIDYYWQDPADISGIKEYRYYLSFEGEEYVEGDHNKIQSFDKSNRLKVELNDDFTQGEVYIHIDAYDHAGNINDKNSNKLKVNVDRVRPEVQLLSVSCDIDDLSSKIKWSCSENTAQLKLTVESDSWIRDFVVEGDKRELIIPGLTYGENYSVKLLAYSNSIKPLINIDNKNFIFSNDINSIRESKVINFAETIHGFEIKGFLDNVENISYAEINHQYLSKIELNNVELIENQFESAFHKSNSFNENIKGFNLTSTPETTMVFNRNTGLNLSDLLLELPTVEDALKEIPFESILFTATNELECYGFNNNFTLNIFNSSIWNLVNINGLHLVNESLKFLYGEIVLTELNNTLLRVKNVSFDSEMNFLKAEVDNVFNLDLITNSGVIELKVIESKIVQDLIVISKGLLLVNGEKIEIYNLQIDRYGNIVQSPIILDPVELKLNNETSLIIDSLILDQNGVNLSGYVVNNKIKIEGSTFNNLLIDSSGITNETIGFLEKPIRYTTSDGFVVTCDIDNILLTHRGYLLKEATIDLSQFNSENFVNIYNLQLDFNMQDIIEVGRSELESKIYLTNSEYFSGENGDFTLKDIYLTNSGLFAAYVEIPLPEHFVTTDLKIKDMKLTQDSGRVIFSEGINLNLINELQLGNGYTLIIDEFSFDQNRVVIPEMRITPPEGCSPETLTIKDGMFNFIDFYEINFDEDFNYRYEDWNLTFNSPILNQYGIEGELEFDLPIDGVNQIFNQERVQLRSNGEVIFSDKMSCFFNLGDYPVEGRDLYFSTIEYEPVLCFKELIFAHGNRELTINNIAFNFQGNILNQGSLKSNDRFKSSNGIETIPNNFKIIDSRLFLSGDLFLPSFTQNYTAIELDNYQIELKSNFNLITSLIADPVIMERNGIEVVISDFCILDENFFIGSSSITCNDKEIKINDALFNLYGDLLYQGNYKANNNEVSIGIWPLNIKECCFSDSGISMEAIVNLPAPGAPQILFKEMQLYKKENELFFQTDTIINSLDFAYENFSISLEQLILNGDVFTAYGGNITIDESEIFSGTALQFKKCAIGSEGNFELEFEKDSKLTLWDYIIHPVEFSLDKSELLISGEIEFSEDFIISELRSKTVEIETLVYDLNNNDFKLDIILDDLKFEIIDGWKSQIERLTIENNTISIDRGLLYFPSEWMNNISVDSVEFINMRSNSTLSNFSIGEILISDIEVSCLGYDFTISALSYNDDGFSFGGEFPLDGLFQGETEAPILRVNDLLFSQDFSIKHLDAQLEAKNLALTTNRELIYSGTIGVDTDEGEMFIDLSGELLFNDNFLIPELIGDKLNIEEFHFDMTSKEIKSLSASYVTETKHLLGIDLDNIQIGCKKIEGEDLIINLQGAFNVPEEYPVIGSETFLIDSQFNSSGQIKKLNSSIILNSDKLLSNGLIIKQGSRVDLVPVYRDSKIDSVDFKIIDGKAELNKDFKIEGLQGSEILIDSLIVNSYGEIKECDLTYLTPEYFEMFDNIYLKDGSISFNCNNYGDVTTSIDGTLELSEEYGGIIVSIEELTIDSDGNYNIDAEASDLSCNFFDNIDLYNGNIIVTGNNDLLFDISGYFKLSSMSLPEEIRNAELYGNVEISAKKGIQTFSVGLTNGSNIKYDINPGVVLEFEQFLISDSGIKSNASLQFKKGFLGLDSLIETTGDIELDWNGNITESNISIGYMNIVFANMTSTLTGIKLKKNYLTFEEATIKLPESLGGHVLGIEHGSIDNNGSLSGDFTADEIVIDILECKIILKDPDFDKENDKITCSSADFKLPTTLGGAEVALKNVSIGSKGLDIDGGKFTLPNIETGVLKFTNLNAELTISEDDYEIGGSGAVFIAGIGEVEANISLVNISQPDYPIGLKHAYFSFTSATGGVPLGPTGLVMNGIRGGLAFGEPGEDLPEKYRDYFSSGIRVQLGVTISDTTRVMEGRVDFWLSVTNADFVLQGEMDFMESLFTTHATALYTDKYGFEVSAAAEFDLLDKLFLEGLIRAHIFEKDNAAKFCAEAVVDMYVQDLIWDFPEKPFKISTVGIELGDFKNNKKGVKGYITLNIFGTKGFYAGTNGEFRIGNVNSYSLLDKSKSFNLEADIKGTIDKRYKLEQENDKAKDNIERIIFCVNFSDGDPQLTAISPSGIKYREGDDNIIVERLNNKILMAVVDPEPGEWRVEVENLLRSSEYKVEALSFIKNPEITITSPVNKRYVTDGKLKVEGSLNHIIQKQKYQFIYQEREEVL